MESNESNVFYKYFGQIYQYTCIAMSVGLVVWCISIYMQNNSISKVEYSKFQTTEEDIYPSFSLCFGDILLQEKLALHGVEEQQYLDFLKGKIWEDRLIDIDYHEVSVNLTDYLVAIEMYQENFNGEVEDQNYDLYDKTNLTKSEQWKPIFYQDSNPFFGLIQKCLTVDIPYSKDQQKSWITVVMNKSVFVGGKRPFNTRESSDMFSVNIHYPNQRYRYSKTKRDWDAREPKASEDQKGPLTNTKSYGMKFYVFGLEVIQKRNTKQNRCNESTIDDDTLKSHMINNISCTPPYMIDPQNRSKSDCSTQQQLKEFYKMSIRSYLVPCRRMTQITYLYSEYVTDYYHQKLENLSTDQDILFVSLMFPDSRYKEIEMIREFNVISLLGNAGGYVGICVGYSILQFPNIITTIYSNIKTFSFFKKKTSPSYETEVSIFIVPK